VSFTGWGSGIARFRVPVLLGTLLVVLAAGVWGFGVFGKLVEGGYGDPGSESARAAEVAQQALGAQGGDVLVIYTPATGSIDDPALAQRVRARLDRLPAAAVTRSVSYWQAKTPQLLSADKRSGLAMLTLAGADDAAKMDAYRQIEDDLAVDGATTRVAGGVVLGDATSEITTRDLATAEAISLPIVLVLLLFLFGSLVAASLPVLVGGCAVLGALGILHAVTLTHDVNSFAVNVASLLGLGMAIDYGLFMVGRFREEQSHGRSPAEAVSRTVATAGRTVLFSATLLMIALGGLLLFPQGFLQSLAYGGLAAVGLAALLSLTLLPALLALLGPRVDKLPVRLPRRSAGPAGAGWARLAGLVLKRPVLFVLPILAGLLILASPIRGVHFGEADERVLPSSSAARQALETLRDDFPAMSSAGIQIVVRGNPGVFPQNVAKLPGIAAVTPTGAANGVTVLTATPRNTDPFSDDARDAVRGIRDLAAPAGATVLVGGTTARNVDSLDATVDRLPLMIGLLAGATLVLMFLAFGSILLPVKAVVMSALSLAATFGVLVWTFQDGHLAGLLHVTPAPPEVGIVVLMAAVVFGLSTDYEVFLLSRMVEARTRGATTAEAVTTGLARTGRVISAAAVLLIVVTGAFALSSVTTMRFVGVGMILALILDATVVRMLLVPAVLGLLGNAAWWAPGPLRRLQEKAGLAEYAGEDLFPTESVGRHAAPGSADPRATTSSPRHSWNEADGPRPAWTAERVRPLPTSITAPPGPAAPEPHAAGADRPSQAAASSSATDDVAEVGPLDPIAIPGAPPLFPTPDHRDTETPPPAPPAAADPSLAETVRLDTGERPVVRPDAAALDPGADPDPTTLGPDEVETVDIASIRGDEPAHGPGWLANGPHPGDDSNDQPRTGNGFGARGPAPASTARPTAGDEMSEADRAAETEVLDLDAESAARVAAEQDRSGGGR
jgi:trehalose monomycolate/heme transporter